MNETEQNKQNGGALVWRLVSYPERDGLVCQICGTTKSVKYISGEGIRLCNRCVAPFMRVRVEELLQAIETLNT